ncbi:site-specific integrase [Streptomyces marianii]|uniref:site-specific integrase n=1 Tax=Streptomyces marianii TaxID=1817406 RepID=UPI001F405AC7|nr:site-specific integrase [Streptomyces marianii]
MKLPWIPSEQQWLDLLDVVRREPVRNRVMLALAYDAALRRDELCSLRTDDVDPAHRTLRIRAEATKTRRERVIPYSAPTGVLLSDSLVHRATISRARGPLFLSESRRNHGQPLTLWTWSKVIRSVALTADLPRFSTHTTRHLCLTDLARMGSELHAIATFAGHRHTESTMTYIGSKPEIPNPQRGENTWSEGQGDAIHTGQRRIVLRLRPDRGGGALSTDPLPWSLPISGGGRLHGFTHLPGSGPASSKTRGQSGTTGAGSPARFRWRA